MAKNKAETVEDIRREMKKANVRLARLESAGLTKASNAYQYVQASGKRGLHGMKVNASDQARFSTAGLSLLSIQQLRHIESEVLRFNKQAKTATKTGIDAKYDKAYQTAKSRFTDLKNISKEDYLNAMTELANTKNFERFGSDQVFKILKNNNWSAEAVEAIKKTGSNSLKDLQKEYPNLNITSSYEAPVKKVSNNPFESERTTITRKKDRKSRRQRRRAKQGRKR